VLRALLRLWPERASFPTSTPEEDTESATDSGQEIVCSGKTNYRLDPTSHSTAAPVYACRFLLPNVDSKMPSSPPLGPMSDKTKILCRAVGLSVTPIYSKLDPEY
jgi:hypothetical protein